MPEDQKDTTNIPFILKRSFLGFNWGIIIFLPLLVFGFIALNFPEVFSNANSNTLAELLIFVGIYALIATIYSLIVTQLQFIERIIRLYTNNQQSSDTISVAKKIFRNSLSFKLKLFFKYYLIALIIALASFGYSFYVIYNFAFGTVNLEINIAEYHIIAVIVIFFLDWIYFHYYISSKLRYVWFSYLNNYGNENSTGEAFNEMNNLNNISGNKTFKKTLFTEDKNDALVDATRFGVGVINSQIKVPNVLSGEAKKIASGYVIGVAGDMASYNTLQINFELYKKAYSQFFGKDFVVNEKLLN
jgi:hypothetical protein